MASAPLGTGQQRGKKRKAATTLQLAKSTKGSSDGQLAQFNSSTVGQKAAQSEAAQVLAQRAVRQQGTMVKVWQQAVGQSVLASSNPTSQVQVGQRKRRRKLAQSTGAAVPAPNPSLAAADSRPPKGKTATRAPPAFKPIPPAFKPNATPPIQAGGQIGSNWAQLQKVIGAGGSGAGPRSNSAAGRRKQPSAVLEAQATMPQALRQDKTLTQVVALDCEMVGVGPNGDRSALARVCIVNNYGTVLLDTFVAPGETVTNFRTHISGVRPSDLVDAPPLAEVQRRVEALVAGRVLVGHALKNDLQALMLAHPQRDIRDTARFPPLMRRLPGRGKARPQRLQALAASELGLAIQGGAHSPVDDARAALYLYHKHKKEWERALSKGGLQMLRMPQHREAGLSLKELAASDAMADL